MSFDNTIDFKDHIVQYPNRFKQTTVAPGVVELVPTWITNSDEIIEPGTPVDSELFKKLKQNVTIYQQTFTTTENQTVINLDRNFLVGQNRVSLSIGGVRQYAGQDYTETDSHTLTMTTPQKGGLKAEVVMFTASQAIAEDFFEKTMAAIEATQAANDAATQALAAKETAYTVQLTPVTNFAAIATTYPNAVNGSEVQTLDDGKIYRKENSAWVYRKSLTPGPISTLITKMELQKYYASAKEFGVVGDGVADDTNAIQSLLAYARTNKISPHFHSGTYRITGNTPLDISGLTFQGSGVVFDFAAYTGDYAMESNGTRQSIATGKTLAKSTNLITGINTTLKRGDIIVITSDEQIPNTFRAMYRKGGIHYVQDYNASTQQLTVYPAFDFDYTSALIEKMNPVNLNIPSGFTFKGLSNGAQKAMKLLNTIFDLSNRVENFGLLGINAKFSIGKFYGFVRDVYQTNGDTNYGFVVNDCSHVHFIGAEVWGGRHSVSSGGNYPSKVTINGGYFAGLSSVNHAIDAHGIVKDLIVTGAVVHGGIQANADYNNLSKNIIYFHEVSGILAGSDNNSKDWCSLKAHGNEVIGVGTTANPNTAAGIIGFNKLREFDVQGNTIEGNWNGGADNYYTPIFFTAETKIVTVKDNTLKKETNAAANASSSAFYITDDTIVDISDNTLINHQLLIRNQTTGVKVKVRNNNVEAATSHGIRIEGYSNRSFDEVVCNGNVVNGSKYAGIFIAYVKEVVAKLNRSTNNGKDTAVNNFNRSGVLIRYADNVVFSNNESRDLQATATQLTGLYMTDVLTLVLIGNDFRGSTTPLNIGTAQVLVRQGNVNLADYILATNGSRYTFNGTSFTLVV